MVGGRGLGVLVGQPSEGRPVKGVVAVGWKGRCGMHLGRGRVMCRTCCCNLLEAFMQHEHAMGGRGGRGGALMDSMALRALD